MVKHIAIGAGCFGFDFWARIGQLAQLLSAQVIGAEGLGFDSRDGQIGTESPTARHRCDVSVLPKRKEMGPSDARRGRESALPFPLDNCRKNETFLF